MEAAAAKELEAVLATPARQLSISARDTTAQYL
jgi:hypothetical protein